MTVRPHYGAMFTRIRILLALAVVGAVAAAAGTALAASQGTDSQVTISPRTVVASAGQTSPVDVGGARAVRAGKPIPAGYVLVGRHVKFTRGTEVGYGALTMRCPAGKTLRGLALQGQVGPQVVRDTHYAGKRSVFVIVDYNTRITPVGGTAEGTVLALCR
jgi:hypothetical protein